MISFIPELNQAQSIEYTINLGFTLNQYRAGYKKFFWDITYIPKKVVFIWTREQIQLFNIWYNESLMGGVELFEADFDLKGTKTYRFVDIFTYSNNEAELYNVQFELLELFNVGDLLCLKGNTCLNLLISNLTGTNNMIEASIQCPAYKMQANLCLTNLFRLIEQDVNNYTYVKILL